MSEGNVSDVKDRQRRRRRPLRYIPRPRANVLTIYKYIFVRIYIYIYIGIYLYAAVTSPEKNFFFLPPAGERKRELHECALCRRRSNGEIYTKKGAGERGRENQGAIQNDRPTAAACHAIPIYTLYLALPT